MYLLCYVYLSFTDVSNDNTEDKILSKMNSITDYLWKIEQKKAEYRIKINQTIHSIDERVEHLQKDVERGFHNLSTNEKGWCCL